MDDRILAALVGFLAAFFLIAVFFIGVRAGFEYAYPYALAEQLTNQVEDLRNRDEHFLRRWF